MPLSRRDDARALSVEAEPRPLSKPELERVRGQRVDAERDADLVEVHVAGDGHRLAEIHLAVAHPVPAVEAPVAVVVVPRALDRGLVIDVPLLQPGERRDELVRRRREPGQDRLVEHRVEGVVVAQALLLLAQAPRPRVRVEAGLRVHPEDGPVPRVERHERAAERVSGRLLEDRLQLHVDREVHVAPCDRVDVAVVAEELPVHVLGLDLASDVDDLPVEPGRAPEDGLKRALEPRTANVVARVVPVVLWALGCSSGSIGVAVAAMSSNRGRCISGTAAGCCVRVQRGQHRMKPLEILLTMTVETLA